MRKLLVLLPILATLLIVPTALAQDSPFGGLTTQPIALRMHENISGQTIKDYTDTVDNYENLLELYERAFGTRKVELEEQILARTKDMQVAKLGSTQTYLKNLLSNLEGVEVASEESLSDLSGAIGGFDILIPSLHEDVEAATTTQEVLAASNQINESVEDALDTAVPHLSMLSVVRGEVLILIIEEKAAVIQEHLRESGALGGDIAAPQKLFEDSMLSLEDARDDYEELAALVGDGSNLDTRSASIKELEGILDSSTRAMRKASEGLNDVVGQLRILYGQSPWTIETAQFKSEEMMEEILEDAMEEEVEADDAMEAMEQEEVTTEEENQ